MFRLQRSPTVWGLLALLIASPLLAPAQPLSSLPAGVLTQLSAEERAQLEQYLAEQGSDSVPAIPRPDDVDEQETVEPRNPLPGGERSDRRVERPEGRGGSTDTQPEVESPGEFTSRPGAPLEPFGYELFAGKPDTFQPVTNIPVPQDYVLGPGDQLRVQLLGNRGNVYVLTVNRDGAIDFPDIGPIQVAGLPYEAAQEVIIGQVQEKLIGVEANISLGPLRSIRVFVLGDAFRPGSYSVSALSTITNVLFVSGGIELTGSLRNIALKRGGETVTELDLYDFLLRGDTSGDLRVQPGDAIFVGPLGPTVAVAGDVRRPAIYEIESERTVGEILEMAGGLTPEAFRQGVKLERIDGRGERTIIDIDLTEEGSRQIAIRGGDRLFVPSVLDNLRDVVKLSGHVERPGFSKWREGMRLSDLIPSAERIKPKADLRYVVIRREVPPNRRIEVLSVDLYQTLTNPGGAADPELRPRDEVLVFPLGETEMRTRQIGRLLSELLLQSTEGEPVKMVTVSGRVHAPGDYPLEADMRVSDLIRAGGSLTDSAFLLGAELSRYTLSQDDGLRLRYISIDLARALEGDPAHDFTLTPYDRLHVKTLPDWNNRDTVEVGGEVRFPGAYTIQRSESLQSVIDRAGGLTELAFPEGTLFLRERLREKENELLQQLAAKLEADLAVLTIQRSAHSNSAGTPPVEMLQFLLRELRSAEAQGRIVLASLDDDPERRISQETAFSGVEIDLEPGDRILIPKKPVEVTVMGEVQFPTSHLFAPGFSVEDYIEASGGATYKADKDRIYIVRASGKVVTPGGRSVWFRGERVTIQPGDSIVVPLKVDRVPKLVLWQGVTQVLYNLALAAAAVNSF